MTAGALQRRLGLPAVVALVAGNILGSGVFFTPGELASVAQHPWQVHFIWALCGLIALCGALTLAEECCLLPRAGATYHVLREGFGPLWGFLLVWIYMWVSGPGAVGGIAVVFGDYMQRLVGQRFALSPVMWGSAAIVFFAAINLAGVVWGARVQVLVTAVKILGIAGLVAGGLWLAAPAPESVAVSGASSVGGTLVDFFRFTGLGVAAVLFTYDGWIDVSHVAGEVRRPERNLPLGLATGVLSVTLLYLIVNIAYLRVLPLPEMRAAPTTVASTVATAAYGPRGGPVLDVLMMISIFGALGGLVMTLPRLFYAMAADHAGEARGALRWFFTRLGHASPRTAIPSGAIVFTAVASITALAAFGSFSRIVNFFVVPFQAMNILFVAAIFPLRARRERLEGYRTPGYPWTPLAFILVMAAFLVSAIVARPLETLVGSALAMTGVPVYLLLRRKQTLEETAHDVGR